MAALAQTGISVTTSNVILTLVQGTGSTAGASAAPTPSSSKPATGGGGGGGGGGYGYRRRLGTAEEGAMGVIDVAMDRWLQVTYCLVTIVATPYVHTCSLRRSMRRFKLL